MKHFSCLLVIGLPAKKPNFMLGPKAKKNRIRQYVEIPPESDSDDDWTPSKERQDANNSKGLS